MGMTSFIRGGISVLTGIIGLYALEIFMPMDNIYMSFNNLIPKLPMNVLWKGIAQGTLGGWIWYDRAFVICIIALFIWWVSTIFIDVDYGKQYGKY